MTIEQLRNMQHAVPFVPYRIHTAEGRLFDVSHRDFLSSSLSGRTIIVHGPDDKFSVLDMLLVTELEALPQVTTGVGS